MKCELLLYLSENCSQNAHMASKRLNGRVCLEGKADYTSKILHVKYFKIYFRGTKFIPEYKKISCP